METRIRSENRVSRYGFSFNSTYCSKPYLPITYSHTYKFESVSSYRGKPMKITVGNKVRRVFNSFTRYRYEYSPPTLAKVCVMNSTPYIGWVEDFPLDDVKSKINVSDPLASRGVAWSGDLPPIFKFPLEIEGAKLRDFTIRDMYAKLNSPRWNAAVFLAELDETIIGIHDLLKGISGVLLKEGIAKKYLRAHAKSPEGLWLWYRYMLMPLILSVEELIAVITEKQQFVDRVQDGSRITEPELTHGTFVLENYGYGLVDVQVPFKASTRWGTGGAIDVLSKFDPAPWGTSAHDTLMAAWERTKLSFVFDWVVNVGDWLASLRTTDVLLAQSYATYAIESKVEFLDGTYEQMGENPYCSTFLMNRITDVNPPKLPLIDRRWRNTLRTLDATALIIGFLKGILRRHK